MGAGVSELIARVEAMRAISNAKAEAQRTAVREAMPADMAAFLDEWREGDPDVKLTFIETPTFKAGKEGERGIRVGEMILISKETPWNARETAFKEARKR